MSLDSYVNLEKLPPALLRWYPGNHRDLPWRQTSDPYRIWVSEIMLQQTRVEAVRGYYARFLTELPTVADLADCDDDRLGKLWEGLGYYSRVRNMKKAAVEIMTRFGGRFPDNYADILSLPGVGAYTAGAVASIAFNLPTPAVDGNVLRVISRLTEDDTPIDNLPFRREVERRLGEIYPADARTFTQALMELGATLCGPNTAPDCDNCPCQDFCGGYLHHSAEQYPVRLPKRAKKRENRTVFILRCGDSYALCRRPEKGLLAGLWQFPDVAGTLELTDALDYLQGLGLSVSAVERQVERKHIFTHIIWEMRGFYLEVKEKAGDFVWMTARELTENAALPTAYRQFWEETGVHP